MLWQPPIPEELWDQIPPAAPQALRARFGQYEQRLRDLQAQLDDLRRLHQNSTNSSKPPATDAPGPKRRPPQPASGRRRGGQPGRSPTARPLVPPTRSSRPSPSSPATAAAVGMPPRARTPGPGAIRWPRSPR